jgi:hypothetical protein
MKPRPTEAEFDDLKRKRDEAINNMIDDICAKQGWDRSKVHAHVSGAGDCYCACPDGPCQHIWDGEDYQDEDEGWISATCSRCGTPAIHHDIRVLP